MSRGRTLGFRRRLILIAVVSMALILGLAATIAISASSYREYNESTRHSYLVERQILGTRNALRSAESGLRGYLLSGENSQLEMYLTQLPKISEDSARLEDMTSTNPQQHQRAQQLHQRLQERMRHMQVLLKQFHEGGAQAMTPLLLSQLEKEASHPIATLMNAMHVAEQQHLLQAEQRRAHSANLTLWSTVACLSLALLLMISAVLMVIREQRNALDSKEALMQAYLQLAQSLEESRGMADRMQRLHMLSESLQNCRSMREAMQVIPPSLEDMLPDTAGMVLLVNASHNMVEKAASWGELMLETEPVFSPDDCLALRRGQVYPDPDSHLRIPCAHLDMDGSREQPVSWLCIPLLAQGEALGIMHLQYPGKIRADMHELSITLGEQLGLLLGNLRLQESLRIQSIRDPLTGLFNRRYLEASLRRELLRNARHGHNLTLLMLDVDHFKRFNDVHGHDAGDELLQQLAVLFRDMVRAEDIACRYGGEEFTIILPETGQSAGLQRAEDIRESAARLKVRHRGTLLGPVSISIGLATQDRHGDDAAVLLHAADQALYRAKRAGRNRVEVAGEQDRMPSRESAD